MADKIISELLNDKDDVITETIRLINKCAKEMPQREEEDKSEENKNKIIALKNKKNVLLTYLLDGTITKEAFNIKSVELDEEIKKLEEMPKYQQPKKEIPNIVNIQEIKDYLERILTLSENGVSEELIDAFVVKIVPTDDGSFNWVIRLSDDKGVMIPCVVSGRKGKATLEICDRINCRITYCKALTIREIALSEGKNALRCCLHHRLLSQNPSNIIHGNCRMI